MKGTAVRYCDCVEASLRFCSVISKVGDYLNTWPGMSITQTARACFESRSFFLCQASKNLFQKSASLKDPISASLPPRRAHKQNVPCDNWTMCYEFITNPRGEYSIIKTRNGIHRTHVGKAEAFSVIEQTSVTEEFHFLRKGNFSRGLARAGPSAMNRNVRIL